MQDDIHRKKDIDERPIDPTRNAEDILGDTSGMSGVTRGTARQTSAEPSDVPKDTSYFKGGTIHNPKHPNATGIPKSSVSDKENKKEMIKGMGDTRREINEHIASEPNDQTKEGPRVEETPVSLPKNPIEKQSDMHKYVNTSEASFRHPENLGEQDAVGGTTSFPETDDDVGDMTKRMGENFDKDADGDGYENDPVDTAKQVDEAEEYKRTH